MKNKYKAGDKVIIRGDLKVGERYHGFYVTESMEKLAGQTAEIEWVEEDSVYDSVYTLKGYPCAWAPEMFEGLAEEVNPTIKPDYYQYRGGDVFDMAQHFNLNFPLGNALKYLVRAGHKDPDKKVEDLQKCIKCINRAIELEAGRGD
jgi:hypothetical protein